MGKVLKTFSYAKLFYIQSNIQAKMHNWSFYSGVVGIKISL